MIYGPKGTDDSLSSTTMFFYSCSAQQDLLCPCLSEVAPPEASRILGEDEEVAAEEWGGKGASKGDKVKRACNHLRDALEYCVPGICSGPPVCRESLMRRSLNIS